MESVHNFFNSLSDALGIIIILIIALALFCMILGAIELMINPQAAYQAAQEYPSTEQKVNSARHSVQVAVPRGNMNKEIWNELTDSLNMRGSKFTIE